MIVVTTNSSDDYDDNDKINDTYNNDNVSY